MRLDHPWVSGLTGLLVNHLAKALGNTTNCKVAYHDPICDPANPACDRQRIYLLWHEYLALPLHQRRHTNVAMLLSRHRDADILESYAHHAGFGTVRGSTNRGGAVALRQLLEKSRRMHLAITPDGPRGPRRKMAAGAIYLASRLQMPLVLIGIGFDRPWRMPTWDRFAIPRPYSRARFIMSQDLYVAENLDRDELERQRLFFERTLNDMCAEAEDWAESGRRKPGQTDVTPGMMGGPLWDIVPQRARTTAESDRETASVERALRDAA